MRTLVDIPDNFIKMLTLICKAEHTSRAEVIRKAIGVYIKLFNPTNRNQAFGLWKNKKKNSSKHLQSLRNEWEK